MGEIITKIEKDIEEQTFAVNAGEEIDEPPKTTNNDEPHSILPKIKRKSKIIRSSGVSDTELSSISYIPPQNCRQSSFYGTSVSSLLQSCKDSSIVLKE